MRLVRLPLFFTALLFASALPGRAQTESGWVELFNGKDFQNFGGEGATEHLGYLVKDGVLESTPACRNLMTEKMYEDYILEFEFQLTPGANNGLAIHYPGTGGPSKSGLELQILDNTHPKYAKLKDYQFHGSVYSLQAALRGHLAPVGEWNRQRVTVRGPRITVELNGVTITDANLDELAKTHPKHSGVKRRKGHIGFAGHGDIFRVRKMRIAELAFGPDKADWYLTTGKADERLAAAGFTPLFDGKTLVQFDQDPRNEGHWTAKDGWILRYDGKGSNLWTTREYTDFTVVADWRWDKSFTAARKAQPVLLPNGLQKTDAEKKGVRLEIDEVDSGVLLRGAVRTQVNLWNWSIGSGEVYGIRNDSKQPLPIRAALTPRVPADKAYGEWNRYVITVRGDRLTVYLNGKAVLFDAELPGVRPTGKLGFQHHGQPLEWANLHVKEL